MSAKPDRLSSYVSLIRPYQWTKNLVVFIPLVFSRSLDEFSAGFEIFVGFIVFCMISGAAYALNDVLDAEQDRRHPGKRSRPVASGTVGASSALALSALLMLVGLGVAFLVTGWLALVACGYLANNVIYSTILKRVVLVDVMTISVGFVLRVIAGTVTLDVTPTPWLLLIAFTLALFIGISKRRQELHIHAINAAKSRWVLKDYNLKMLDQALPFTAALVVTLYTLFTISDYAAEQFGSTSLLYTVPFVVYGVLRYFHLIHNSDSGEDPSRILIRDLPMILCTGLWLLTCVVIIYWDRTPEILSG